MKKCNFKCVLFCAVFLIFHAAGFAVSPYEPQVVKAFADSLYQEGFLSQAEGEYKRFLFSFEDAQLEQEANTPVFQSSLISLCNIYKIRQDKDGVKWLNEKFYDYADTPAREKINLLHANFLFKERNVVDFGLFQSGLSGVELSGFSPDFSNLIQTSYFLLNKDIASLKFNVPAFSAQSVNFEKLNELCSSYKTKSPGAAMFFSMVLPGSGKWYTGSFGAFVSSFVTIGSFIAGTVVTGIQGQWKTWHPYVFGACGLVLYITELYGSYKSAQRYNDALFRALCEETENIYEKIY